MKDRSYAAAAGRRSGRISSKSEIGQNGIIADYRHLTGESGAELVLGDEDSRALYHVR
jgi:hypothetical protein